MTASIFVVALLFAIFSRKLQNTKKITLFFIGVLVVIFAMNFGKLLETTSKAIAAAKTNIPIKKDFIVDSKSKSPNIYWIHPDGMLGVNAVKKFFHEDQEELLSKLKERGFEINPYANFEGRHTTAVAVPDLMKWDKLNLLEKK